MRVCFISHSANCGGAEQVLLEHLDVLCEAGVECRVVLPGRGALADELKRMNIPFAIVSFPVWVSRDRCSWWGCAKAALSIVANSLLVAWHIIRWNCEVVYSNTVTVCVGAFAARLTARPHIWHFQEFGKRDHGLSFIFGDRLSIKLLDRLSTRCLCLSNSLASQYAQWVEPSKIAVVYPSMHRTLVARADSPEPGAPVRFRCVIVGALQEGKGQEESIFAMAALEASGIDAELVIYGDGLPGYRNRLLAEQSDAVGPGSCIPAGHEECRRHPDLLAERRLRSSYCRGHVFRQAGRWRAEWRDRRTDQGRRQRASLRPGQSPGFGR
jgi:glycosyltransferase involved in cell wall biosynthesis